MREGQAALFVGAGMSTPVGLPDWKELLTSCAAALDLDIERESDLIAVAQYYINGRGNRSDLNQILRREFDKPRHPTPSHHIIAKLPISTIWTTNFDKVMEQALSEGKKRFDIRSKDADFARARKGEVVLYKMHGDIDDPNEVVLSESDYERYTKTHPIFQNALEGDLITKTFLFLGFSFTDRNLSYMLAGLRSVLGDSKRVHYAIMRKERLNWPDTHPDAEKEFLHRSRKQELHVENLMMRYGIHTLLLDSYKQVPRVLNELKSRFRKGTVLVSGNTSGRGGYGPERLKELCRQLGARLMERDMKVLADFRTDVGRALLNGALQELDENGRLSAAESRLRSLPGGLRADENETRFDEACRNNMARDSGFAIFVGDSRPNDSELLYEFNKASDEQTFLIPIGVSGPASHRIWKKVVPFLEDDLLKQMFERLNDSTLGESQVVDAVFDIIGTISKKAPNIGSREPATLMNREFFVRMMKQFPSLPPDKIRRIMAASAQTEE
ncbi:MAG TPA: SIR2 family protein [Pyrinomonadaceae bacterium]|nr:SIR2 family protein [Pyrinomonadaceae bacterium]